jgi:hypothetical protein
MYLDKVNSQVAIFISEIKTASFASPPMDLDTFLAQLFIPLMLCQMQFGQFPF